MTKMQKAVEEITGDDYAGRGLSFQDLQEVGEKYDVNAHELGNAVLQDGIDQGWLMDEVFCG